VSAPRIIVHDSFGLGSWSAAERVIRQHGSAAVTLLFADVIVEHQDTYRFGIEGAAVLRGMPVAAVADLAARALALPELRSDLIGQRKADLAALRVDAMARIPGLVWIADGRTTFEAMADARYIGNSLLCPAAKSLKHKMLDGWMAVHCQPDDTQCVVGLDWTEQGRIARLAISLRRRGGWTLRCPLARSPRLDKDQMAALARSYGLEPSEAYRVGLAHDNCSGMCVRGGKAHWAQVRQERPVAFAFAMGEEQRLRALVGPHAMLKEQRKGVRRYLPLYEFDARLRTEELTADEATEIGGCGCGADTYDDEAA
jgi:hypothetical protein